MQNFYQELIDEPFRALDHEQLQQFEAGCSKISSNLPEDNSYIDHDTIFDEWSDKTYDRFKQVSKFQS